jgi:putative transposase
MIQASIQQPGGLGIEALCALAGLARSGYDRHWQASAPRQEETAVRDAIQRLSLADRKLGYRPITVLLKREGFVVNHKRVERIRRSDNLLCLRKRAFRPATTDSEHGYLIYPNLAAKLVPTAINQLWVADIAYVRLSEQFVYLAVVLDAFSRRVVGWARLAKVPTAQPLECQARAWRIICAPNWPWRRWRWRYEIETLFRVG